MKRPFYFFTLLLFYLSVSPAGAQNMTDLAVMNDRSAEQRIVQSDYSTVDDSVFMHPDRIRFDHRCLQIDGKDQFVLSGTFHYFRTPQPLWRDRLEKLRAAGFNCVETYVPWNWHEQQMPQSPSDESKLDMQQLEDFLSLADSLGLYSIVRPGPYICAEWSGGGFPQWLMRKKPANPLHEVWLQSNDPEFVRWNEHWYKAVCQVVKSHQIQNRPVGQGGVILFQVENEYNRIKWFPGKEKRQYLENLTLIARRYGIEVPIITCWTNEARNVKEGPLNGVVDMVNSYPRWNIEKGFGRLINQQLKSQPGKPLISGELQGGWYSDVAGKLSWQQEGVAAVQTQNITLYALQRGFCALNFYMAIGGTNFDDWAARGVTTTYDFAAAIGEDGTTNERYDRLQALAPFLMEHGPRIAHAQELYPAYQTTDSTVMVALRQTADGDRYYFVRTEEHDHAHNGQIMVDGLTLDFSLEPFGSVVYYVRNGEQTGACYPKPLPQIRSPKSMPSVKIIPTLLSEKPETLPKRWTRLPEGKMLDDLGIYSRHPIWFRSQVSAGDTLHVGRIGKGVVNGTAEDIVRLWIDGQQIKPIGSDDHEVRYVIPHSKKRKQSAMILYYSLGLHHHTNWSVEQHWKIGLEYVRQAGRQLPLSFDFAEGAQRFYAFETPSSGAPVWLHFNDLIDGFVTVNGHAIGRMWATGPQHDFYVPECWLRSDGKNHVIVSHIPE